MTKRPQRQTDPGVLAVLNRAGEAWSGLIVNTRSTPPAIIDARTFPGSDARELNDWIETHRAAEALVVLPAGSAICRTCTLPAAEPEQLEQALALQAEAHLLGTAPAHRTGMAVLDAAPGETSRTGLVLAWPEAAPAEVPALATPVSVVPPAASLAALIDGHRPTHPIVWIDRSDGSVALAITHANGAVFRATREDMGDAATWQAALARVVTETALSVGHTPEFIERIVAWTQRGLATVPAGGAALLLPEDLIEQNITTLQDVPADPQWWSTHGLAVGAAIARLGSLAPLTRLQVDLPQESPNVLRRVGDALSRPGTATRIAIAALLVLALGPMAFHGLRLQTLKARYGDLSGRLTALDQARSLRAMYTELDDHRWTMTKLLGDLACNTPEYIDLERIQINHGDSVSVSGLIGNDPKKNLDARDVAALMRTMLQDSGVFTNVSISLEPRSQIGTYEFTLSAELAKPHQRPDYSEEQDFAALPLRLRKYPQLRNAGAETPPLAADVDLSGDPPATAEPEPVVAQAPENDEPKTARTTPPMIGRGGGPGQEGTKSRGRGDTSSDARTIEQEIPDPLTEAQVAAMTRPERITMMGRIAKARIHAKNTANTELHERLDRDWDLLKESLGR